VHERLANVGEPNYLSVDVVTSTLEEREPPGVPLPRLAYVVRYAALDGIRAPRDRFSVKARPMGTRHLHRDQHENIAYQ
jgi:hypothetical protein